MWPTLHGKTASSKEFPECLLAKWAAVELEDIKPTCTYGDYNPTSPTSGQFYACGWADKQTKMHNFSGTKN